MARRKVVRYIDSCPLITEEYKKELIKEYDNGERFDDITAEWIYERILKDVGKWYDKAADEFVPEVW